MGHSLITHYLGPHCWPALGQPASWLGGWGRPALPNPGRGPLSATLLGQDSTMQAWSSVLWTTPERRGAKGEHHSGPASAVSFGKARQRRQLHGTFS